LRPGELELTHDVEADRHTLLLTGELDMATAPELEARAEGLCADGAVELTLDLRGLGFMDSTGLRAILAVREHCIGRTCEFSLIQAPRPVERLFELAGLIDKLPFREPPATP
jgi:anti-sigma B factor antagonist